jgi:hypothetical protein
MEDKRMHFSYSETVNHILALALLGMAPIALAAQDATKPDVKTYANSTASSNAASKWDIFAGFSYLSPRVASDGFDSFDSTGIRYGAIGSVSRYFNKYVGVQFEGDYHNDNNEDHPTSTDFEGGSGGLCWQLLLSKSVGLGGYGRWRFGLQHAIVQPPFGASPVPGRLPVQPARRYCRFQYASLERRRCVPHRFLCAACAGVPGLLNQP